MENADGEAIMGVVLGALARVHALEHTVFALMASHPYPEVALQAWDGAHPEAAERGFSAQGAPQYSKVLQRMMSEHREVLAIAVEAAKKGGR
ncbi:hypothetical protein [Luteimonas fraxinea]|uniref:Uncharacterized protein n=1 Tax=Luteimonas fraxinea TaxID=2901869 RepID=A0ABS8U9M2_9GAMM|nr:hypothetical protein [Luteimonas fraxinea]MCD9096163.1 hypothetical protein [Luteimonas fraxinea]